MTPLEFQELLLQEFPVWSRNRLPSMGLRLITLSKDSLDILYEYKKSEGMAFIQKLKAILPLDAALHYVRDQSLLRNRPGPNGTGSETYHIQVVSEQWEPNIDGEDIQEIDVNHFLY